MEKGNNAMEEPVHIQWMAKYLAGEMSEQETAALMAWVAEHEDHRKFFDETIQLWRATDVSHSLSFQTDSGAAWQKLEARLEEPASRVPTENGKLLSIPPWWLRAAAALLLLLSIGFLWRQFGASPPPFAVATQAGQKMQYQLPDGSQVWLNENTRLTYADSAGLRFVTLEGEAFFDVKRMENKRFVIASGDARTTVLGTSFNMRAYPSEDEVEVTVNSGKVQLSSAGNTAEKVILEPGATGLLNKARGVLQKKTVSAVNSSAWKNQRLDFDGAAFSEVLVALERYFHIQTRVDNEYILRCQFYGSYDKPQLDQLLEVIRLSMELEISRSGDTIVFSGAGCE